jgi:hypothetical protein
MIHIGEVIENCLKVKGISVKKAGEVLSIGRHAMYKRLNKASIDTHELFLLSQATSVNLFASYLELLMQNGFSDLDASSLCAEGDSMKVSLTIMGGQVIDTEVERGSLEVIEDLSPDKRIKSLESRIEAMLVELKYLSKMREQGK